MTSPSVVPTVEDVAQKYLAELQEQNLAPATLRAYTGTMRALSSFLRAAQIEAATDITETAIQNWSSGLDQNQATQTKMCGHVKKFGAWLLRRGILSFDPTVALRANKVVRGPARPLTLAEMRALLYAARPQPDLYALILLMRFSGLSLGDALVCPRAALDGNFLSPLRDTQKVGIVLPAIVPRALAAFSPVSDRHWFWDGAQKREVVTATWRPELRAAFLAAYIDDARSSRLRDTFAAELLKTGAISLFDLHLILGKSLAFVRENFGQWDLEPQVRISQAVQRVWACDPVLAELHGWRHVTVAVRKRRQQSAPYRTA